jgi:2Fe-2S ferredoxin
MTSPRNPITFTVIYEETEHRLLSYHSEYRNLRDLILDKIFIDGFGECGGIGRCATCLVKISDRPKDRERNEQVTLTKAGVIDSSVRLSCQIPIDDELSNAVVTILESL